MFKLGPKCQYFVWLPLFSSTALTLLGRVHQNFTGYHWSPLPLLHDDVTELVDVRDLAHLHLLFQDAPQMLNRVYVSYVYFSKPTSGYDVQTQLLWSTMARPVLSGTGPVKPLYGLGCSSVSGSWQSYSLGHLYVEQQLSDPQFIAMRCHVELPVTSISESNNTKFNIPAPPSHLRPCNTIESHDIREGKWLLGPHLDIITFVAGV
ncbi:hypothetical protein E2320_011319 [Naja naja]|nr:hypothetical protein E2320_011319 [Naja naja]